MRNNSLLVCFTGLGLSFYLLLGFRYWLGGLEFRLGIDDRTGAENGSFVENHQTQSPKPPNPQPKISNPEAPILNPEPETQIPKPGTLDTSPYTPSHSFCPSAILTLLASTRSAQI